MEAIDVVLEGAERGPGCGIRLPFDPKVTFGRARAPVVVTVNGHDPFRTTTMSYGGASWIGLRRDQQREFGVAPGDQVTVTVERDDLPREVELPAELADILNEAPDASARFDALSYTHRREYARWIAEAKRHETRLTRAAKAIEMLRADVRTPGRASSAMPEGSERPRVKTPAK